MKKVITYGTFDLLHTGHINILRRAKELGDYLIVAVSTDEFNTLKHKEAYHSFEERKQILEAIKYVDEVIGEDSWDQKTKDVKNIILILSLWGMTGKANSIFLMSIVMLFISLEPVEYQRQKLKKS